MPKSRKARRFEPQKKIENASSTVSALAATTIPTPARTSAPSKIKSIAERYPYVRDEVKRVVILTASVMVILAVLYFILR